MKTSALLLVLGLLLSAVCPADAGQPVVLGDSIGVGVSMVSNLPRRAKNSVAIRSKNAVEQIRQTPPNTVAFLSLGTNDAVGSIKGVDAGIERILAAASNAKVTLIWIGPPCVLKSWNSNVAKLDTILREQLAGRATYVSISDDSYCNRKLRGKDGVHFTMRGYRMVWEQAQLAAGMSAAAPTTAAAATQAPAEVPPTSFPIPPVKPVRTDV